MNSMKLSGMFGFLSNWISAPPAFAQTKLNLTISLYFEMLPERVTKKSAIPQRQQRTELGLQPRTNLI